MTPDEICEYTRNEAMRFEAELAKPVDLAVEQKLNDC